MEEECYLCGGPINVFNGLCVECASFINDKVEMTIYKKCRIEIAHKLEGHKKCGSIHGHSINIVIGLRGKMCVETGMVIDFSTIKHHIQKEIINRFDHGYLNDTLPVPTAEFLALFIYQKLNTGILKNLVFLVRVHETENNYVEYTGEQHSTKNRVNTYETLHTEIKYMIDKYNLNVDKALAVWEDGINKLKKNKTEESEWRHVCSTCQVVHNPKNTHCPNCGKIRMGIAKCTT